MNIFPRFDMDYDDEVLYCYEIQVEADFPIIIKNSSQ